VDFVRYAERAAALVNAPLDDLDDLNQFLDNRAWMTRHTRSKDVPPLRRLQRDLRKVFESCQAGDEQAVVDQVNSLLRRHRITPYLHRHDPDPWHLHVGDRGTSIAEDLSSEAVFGLAIVVADLGADRFGVCCGSSCDSVFVDTSPNRSRRYCSDRCSSRANVAAYRARRKAAL
jgi:predicted RNA-binding Zn ribbon-like protein